MYAKNRPDWMPLLGICVVILGATLLGKPAFGAAWPAAGDYSFKAWSGPELSVFYSVPDGSGPQTPILIVIPGARRNADEYRDQWHDLAHANGFIVLTLAAKLEDFPTEYDYNAGGVLDAKGQQRPEHSLTRPHERYQSSS